MALRYGYSSFMNTDLTSFVVPRRSFLALARMVIWPSYYYPSDKPPSKKAAFPEEESLSELIAARYITIKILEHNNILVESLLCRDLTNYRWLGDSSVPRGDDGVIEIPDLHQEFRNYDHS